MSKLESPQAFAARLNLPFRNFSLLARALTHRSYINENPGSKEDNERLEFLGDAVLDFLVAAWLYEHMPEMPEGRLTSLRAALVCNEQLADFARTWQLGNALRLGRGEEESGGRDREHILGSAFEAVIAALYLDQGLDTVANVLNPILGFAAPFIAKNNLDQDAKSVLQEHTQSHGLGTPEYVVIEVTGPDHQREYVVEVRVNGSVWASGRGKNKQAATKAAARAAILRL